MKPAVGFIGLGTMGLPMAGRILSSGYPLVVYNRTQSKTDDLVARGAIRASSPAEAAVKSDVLLSMVSDPAALEEVVKGEMGTAGALRPGTVHVDMSTVSPSVITEVASLYRSRSVGFLHSPVLGSVPQAAEGSLLLFVGGGEETYRKAKSVLDLLGTKHWRFPEPEKAATLKLLCNMFIAGMIAFLGQGVALSRKSGIDPAVLLEVLGNSALNAPMYQTKGAAMISEKFLPARFYGRHLLKDVDLVLGAARELDVPLPVMESVRTLVNSAVLAGYGDEDYAAVVKVIGKEQ